MRQWDPGDFDLTDFESYEQMPKMLNEQHSTAGLPARKKRRNRIDI